MLITKINLGNYNDQLNCKKNDKNNLWLIDGTLAIAALWKVQDVVKNNGKQFTSALIKTEQDFSYSRIEIRASLPRGKLLRPAIYLEPKVKNQPWPEYGAIDIMVNAQNPTLWHGVHALFPKDKKSIGSEYNIKAKLSDFHTYILEWNESMVVWKFDQDTLKIVNLTKE